MSKIKGSPGYRAGWCIHYRAPFMQGIGSIPSRGDKICEAGVVFADLERPWPCFLDKSTLRPKDADAVPCSKLRPPTPDEVAEHEAWFNERMAVHAKVGQAVIPWRKAHKGQSFSEAIECPACKGRLHLSIAACNGHVHGHCETAGCVSWME